MAEYVVFIYDDEQAWEDADPRTYESTLQAHKQFIAANGASIRGGNRLHPAIRQPRFGRAAAGA